MKILIGLVVSAAIMWLIFSMGDTPDGTIKDVFLKNGRANIENIDPIYTNAMINAKTYGLVDHVISKSEISQFFFSTYIGKDVKEINIEQRKTIGATEIASIFSNYTFINTFTLESMQKFGILKSGNATSLNSNFQNYNLSSIQSMLQAREKIPQFAAYNYTVKVQFTSGTEILHAIVMRAISSASGEPYKHVRWVVSYIY